MKANSSPLKKALHPSQIKVTLGLTKYALLANFRNKTSLAFGLIFPLAFVAIFGLIGNSTTKLNLGIPDNLQKQAPLYQAVKGASEQKGSPISIQTGSQADLEKLLSQSKLDGILENGTTPDSVTLATSNGNPQGAALSQNILDGILNNLNFKAASIATPRYSLSGKEISGKSYNYIDFALPGQIGFSLISLATFGVAFSFISLRKTLVLKRLFATTVTPLAFVISQCLARAVQAVVQSAIIIGVGVWAFHFNLINGWETYIEMLLLSALAALCFLGFGMLLANIARDEESAPIAINLFNLPQLLLSGVFFPLDGMPNWVQTIGNNLPLSFFTNGLRKISVEGAGFHDIYPYLLGMLAWGLVAYALAAKTFRSE